MSNPAEKKADTQEKNTFADDVNKAVSEMTKDAKGNNILPEGLSEEVKVAAMSEKRYRDTQSAYTKANQKTKALEAEKAALLTRATDNVNVKLTDEQAEEIETLKYEDPEAYRKKMNAYEQDAINKRKVAIDEELKQVSTSSLETGTLEQRQQTMSSFNEAHPEFKLDDDIIANEIPPRITKRLETGEISFEAFLQECYDYTKTGKVIKQDTVTKQPNLSKVGGGADPDKNAVNEDFVESYKNETY